MLANFWTIYFPIEIEEQPKRAKWGYKTTEAPTKHSPVAQLVRALH